MSTTMLCGNSGMGSCQRVCQYVEGSPSMAFCASSPWLSLLEETTFHAEWSTNMGSSIVVTRLLPNFPETAYVCIFATYPVVANVPGAHVIFNIVFFITIVSLVIQGTTVSWVARLLGLSTPLEKTGNDFGVELPEEIDSNLHDMTITQEMLEQADTLKDMNLPKGTLVMIVKRGDEYLIPNGTLKLHAGDKLLLISENSKE